MNKKWRIDLQCQTLSYKSHHFMWIGPADSDEDRIWYYAKYVPEDEPTDSDWDDIEDSEGNPAYQRRSRVKRRKLLRLLDQIVDKAERQKKQEGEEDREETIKHIDYNDGEETNDDSDGDKDEVEEDTSDDTHADDDAEGSGRAKPEEGGTKPKESVSVRLKSETSDYALNFRAARSKKQKDLYNFSVHLGSKFLGFVEVKRKSIVEFGRRLQELG